MNLKKNYSTLGISEIPVLYMEIVTRQPKRRTLSSKPQLSLGNFEYLKRY